MMKKFTEPEKKVLGILQRDLPVVSRPFDEAAAMCGLSVAQLFDLLKTLKTEGVMRRFGAALRHQKAGYTRNALVVWSVGPQEIETAGRICAQAPSISHCYERRPPFLGKYDLFTMLHTQSDDLSPLVAELSLAINCSDFLVLESLQELKKTSPEYF
ncbi:MAG TPA: hypothetical protein PLB14_05880 [Smithellaceae bacterium]|jgi:DNA-binding Lrp family transcriptional regulator|nr:hypothetical protein [Smithellaceae bacterium]HPV49218.1 hypothetical protein [Smithellaceae bacterium]